MELLKAKFKLFEENIRSIFNFIKNTRWGNLPCMLLVVTLLKDLAFALIITITIIVLMYIEISLMLNAGLFPELGSMLDVPFLLQFLIESAALTFIILLPRYLVFIFPRSSYHFNKLSSYKALQDKEQDKGLRKLLPKLLREHTLFSHDENFRLAFREVCERELKAFLRVPIGIIVPITLFPGLIISFFLNKSSEVLSLIANRIVNGILNNPASLALAFFAGAQLYIAWNSHKKEVAPPVVSIYTSIYDSMNRIVLLATVRNTSKLEYLVEGGGYKIPSCEEGRLDLRRSRDRATTPSLLISPGTTDSLELILEPAEKKDSCREKSGGLFALLSLRLITHERRGPLTSFTDWIFAYMAEEPRRVHNLMLLCYLDPQAGRAEVVYELPGRI